ncbi:MAG TPA: hypothetical protein VHE83_18375 [Mycobacteriales bacterium]|nr:hypothetical protein [Mycobacteriales bacterium]
MAVLDTAQSALERGIDAAMRVQRPAVQRHIARVRARHPEATPNQVVGLLETHYQRLVAGIGAAAGASAAAPGLGTAAGLALNVAEISAFLEATSLFCLAVAEVHGIPLDDARRRRALLYVVLLGDSGSKIVGKVMGAPAKEWGRLLEDATPIAVVETANKLLGQRFLTRAGRKQGALLLGRELPLGVGALIGGVGNHRLASEAIKAARKAFGPAPVDFPRERRRLGMRG